MLIALSGAQCTGKTTLLNALKSDPLMSNRFTFVDEIVRTIQKKGFKINEAGNDETQVIVMQTHSENTKIPGDTLLDRCALDGMVYTTYMWRHHKISRKTYYECLKVFLNCIEKYDIIFYLTPEFDIIPDGVRSTNVDFRNEVADIFEEIIKSYKLTVVRLLGGVEERLSAMRKILNLK